MATGADARGYLRVIYEFLEEACGPKDNTNHPHRRTAIWGWQRPPLNGQPSVVRIEKDSDNNAVAAALLPFLATNALDSLVVSMAPDCHKGIMRGVQDVLRRADVMDKLNVESISAFKNKQWKRHPYNIIRPEYVAGLDAPLAAQFLTLFFPLGHAKSMNQNDEEFLRLFRDSPKWLKVTA